TFERLSLAGRMFKEVSARNPRIVGLMALSDAAQDLEALLAAGLTTAFQMPAFRSKSDDEGAIERFLLVGPDLIGQA
ncbi:hypothetical protein P8631_23760, partial [Guyparkeria sp. 1SP6A2]|nr:hypothetical protein [Guyparkeria sp. 1SP6A2]